MSFVAPTIPPVSTVVVATAGGRGHGMRMVVAVVHVAVVHRIHVCSHQNQTVSHLRNHKQWNKHCKGLIVYTTLLEISVHLSFKGNFIGTHDDNKLTDGCLCCLTEESVSDWLEAGQAQVNGCSGMVPQVGVLHGKAENQSALSLQLKCRGKTLKSSADVWILVHFKVNSVSLVKHEEPCCCSPRLRHKLTTTNG